MKFLFLLALLLPCSSFALDHKVSIVANQLNIDGESQPQLFGAELQYFRLRGAYGRNVPKARVIALWNKALDQMVAAKMNAISFYIPWDFHEYAEGKFDFTGTVDEDGDGNPDYPSRDLQTFFRLIEEHGIKHILVRPGPYINAEWGFLGFGAIPEWFHNKFPDSHMRAPSGLKTKLYDYHNPDLLNYTRLWFEALYREVLKDKIGPGKPIEFVQIDNETNFMWQSTYNHDYGAPAIARYQQFLQDRYHGSLAALNHAHSRAWNSWQQIKAPTQKGANWAEDQDWYRFQDFSIYTYLQKIRQLWESIGLKEPQVLFTLAESYNAASAGLLPNYSYRNAPGKTGMMTVNLYPKTFETPTHPLHNQPFKADLDVLGADEASNYYLGQEKEWVLGPEVQGGWWAGINISPESRRQTYLSTIGHGMKALFIYYFSEGYNWGVTWAADQIRPLFDELKRERNLQSQATENLDNAFWDALQARVDKRLMIGFDARSIISSNANQAEKLYFDAPLDENANPRGHYDQLKLLGERLFSPYAEFLARSVNAFDPVAIVKDDTNHLPVAEPRIDSLLASSDWAGALLGYTMSEGIHPRVLIGDISNQKRFREQKVLFHIDTGLNDPETTKKMRAAQQAGSAIVNFLSDRMTLDLGIHSFLHLFDAKNRSSAQSVSGEQISFYVDLDGNLQDKKHSGVRELRFALSGPVFTFDISHLPNCEPLLYWNQKVVGYRCHHGGGDIFQIGLMPFDGINSSQYSALGDLPIRRSFLQALLQTLGIRPLLGIELKAQRLTAFARHDQKTLWITLKSSERSAQDTYLKISPQLLPLGLGAEYDIKEPLTGGLQQLTGTQLATQGLRVQLPAEGSTVFVVEQR